MNPRDPLPFDPIEEAQRHWTDHGWETSALGMGVVASIMRVQQLFLARVDEVLRPRDLTFARYEVLMLLAFTGRGSLPLGKIGDRLQVHPASVTNVIDRLETQGLVRRVPHPTDGRATLAEITEAGRGLATKATAAMNSEIFEAIGLSERDATALFNLLRRLRLHAGDFAKTSIKTR
jgi:DNA-binding MarR family transcriptional regulator